MPAQLHAVARQHARFRCGFCTVALVSLTALLLTGCQSSVEQIPTSMPSAAVPGKDSAVPNLAAVAPLELKPALAATVPVYWLGVNGRDIQLYREFRPTESHAEPISAAVRQMTRATPDDPDYFSPWRPAESVSATVSSNNTVTIDISADAFAAPLDEGVARRAVQQLVYTATAAAAKAGVLGGGPTGTVVVLVDGEAGYEAFGHVKLGSPMQRDPRFLAPVWIIDPQEGQVRGGKTVTVSGSGVSPDSRLEWRVAPVGSDKSEPVDSRPSVSGWTRIGTAEAGPGQFSIELDLPPGNYRVSVFDRSDDGQEINADTRDFTVRGS